MLHRELSTWVPRRYLLHALRNERDEVARGFFKATFPKRKVKGGLATKSRKWCIDRLVGRAQKSKHT